MNSGPVGEFRPNGFSPTKLLRKIQPIALPMNACCVCFLPAAISSARAECSSIWDTVIFPHWRVEPGCSDSTRRVISSYAAGSKSVFMRGPPVDGQHLGYPANNNAGRAPAGLRGQNRLASTTLEEEAASGGAGHMK